MAKVRVVQKPGSYRIPPPKQASRKPATPAKSPLQKTKKGGVGRPTLKKARKPRKPLRERANYTEEDIRLSASSRRRTTPSKLPPGKDV